MSSSHSVARSVPADGRYLHLPVRAGAPMRRVSVSWGSVTRTFDIELADEPEWWATVDLGAEPFGTVEVAVVDDLGDAALGVLRVSDDALIGHRSYRETRRPQLRFSAARGWLNDPNGLVFLEGEYHLFFQHNPYGTSWGNMHWGHAVSTDLVHWRELPIALYPDELGPMFSGSAIVERRDTVGSGPAGETLLTAFYTAADPPFSQCRASSTDRGRTWTKYAGNPVVPPAEFGSRDPKVFWHAESARWVMVLYIDRVDSEGLDLEAVQRAWQERNGYAILTSDDLTTWTRTSEFVIPGDGECPELFELAIEGAPGERRWVAFGAMGYYLIGAFDGTAFTAESGPYALSEGDCFYAAQTFNDIPAEDGRRILIPWARAGTTVPGEALYAGMPFSQSMGIPIELTLRETADGLRMFASPIRELATLRTRTTVIDDEVLEPGDDPLAAFVGELWELDLDLELGGARRVVLEIRGTPVVYDADARTLACGGRTARLEPADGRLRIRVVVDRVAIDIFAGDGRVFMPLGIDLSAAPATLGLNVEGGRSTIRSLAVHELESIWASSRS